MVNFEAMLPSERAFQENHKWGCAKIGWLRILSSTFRNYKGVSKNRDTPKWMVYNGNPLLKWMIWGYHYFRKHPSCPKQKLKTCSVGSHNCPTNCLFNSYKNEVHNNSVVWFVLWRESPHVRNETIYFLTDGIYFSTRKLFGFKWFEPGNHKTNQTTVWSSFDYAQLQAMVPPTQISILFWWSETSSWTRKNL